MIFPRKPLLARLRCHRGLWVLAMAVLLIKLVAGTLCLSDGPGARFAASDSSATISVAAADPVVGNDDGSCVLGEAGGCHCVCAHSVTLPTAVALAVARPGIRLDAPVEALGHVPTAPVSLIRPPIA
ncbi:MAG: hypothetical protein ACYC0F_12565 [Rhodanobacter sp.]